MSESDNVIIAEGLTKRYGSTLAVDAIDFTVSRGEILGLLGPNGAGKTTTILMLLGLTEPSGGRITVMGVDPLRAPLEVKRRVGYMPDMLGFYDQLSGRANLRYTARLARIPAAEIEDRLEAALQRVHLADVGDRAVKTYSRGMRQRLAIAEILAKRCEVAILDEPTGGLDPQSTHEFLDLVRSLKNEGMTILLSSHLLDQVQSICDRVALFNRGRIGLMGRVDTLIGEVLGGTHVVRVDAQGSGLAERLRTLEGVVLALEEQPCRYRIEARGDVRPAVARAIVEAGGSLSSLTVGHASLDDVYTHYFAEMHRAA
jgi:ABC-2 type transport system ATP-binding protein